MANSVEQFRQKCYWNFRILSILVILLVGLLCLLLVKHLGKSEDSDFRVVFLYFLMWIYSRFSAFFFGIMFLTLSNVSILPCRKSSSSNGGSELNLHVLLSRLCPWQRLWLIFLLNKNHVSHSSGEIAGSVSLHFNWHCRLFKLKVYFVSIRILSSH